jgi:hypothetical protein
MQELGQLATGYKMGVLSIPMGVLEFLNKLNI